MVQVVSEMHVGFMLHLGLRFRASLKAATTFEVTPHRRVFGVAHSFWRNALLQLRNAGYEEIQSTEISGGTSVGGVANLRRRYVLGGTRLPLTGVPRSQETTFL